MGKSDQDLSTQIAQVLREAILTGQLMVDERLPSEAELAETHGVSRPTIREALKRLAAQSLIRTKRGAAGGAFVNQLRYEDAYRDQITTSTLLLSMNAIDFETACEARFALERACLPLATQRRTPDHLARMRAEIAAQGQEGLSDEGFCASDVAFHRAMVDAAGNPVLSYQLAGAVEAMQPLMNMITFTARNRSEIITRHQYLTDALEGNDTARAEAEVDLLRDYTIKLGQDVKAQRDERSAG
ncbi:FadR/GntR family transcriptional regulator [Actibacterium pelagium]|uniref:HTH gntR-type domain-containing protein n=1 Tax=Actibacterium pelagium TaxID=2029103 RepID=A0A917EI38_9RHOB|nr:FCD domain-containing protein [Actibacterium pelagium]GGE43385.1 hypothetical protein GCM10011517_08770 [Actibacterium pelagium]